jgi:hypothetical protein
MALWFNIIHSGRRVPGKMAREEGIERLILWKENSQFQFSFSSGSLYEAVISYDIR